MIFRIFFLLFFAIFPFNSAFPFSPENHLPDPQEQRARELFLQIKCPVCAGQVIESSDTQIAFEMRKLIREKIMEGKSDEQIKDYFAEHYGEEILVSNVPKKDNFLIWLLPILFLIFGLFAIFRLKK